MRILQDGNGRRKGDRGNESQKASKLLCVQVDIGQRPGRSLPESRVLHSGRPGRSVDWAAQNLKPRSLFGLESQGMILAAEDEKGVWWCSPSADVEPGSEVA